MLYMRSLEISPHINAHTPGSCLVKAGQTHVLCTASYSEKRPGFLQSTPSGWISAEYSMLPHATHSRSNRESLQKPKGRSMEIQRLIARALRAACNLTHLQGLHILVDCDVLQADGSTRTQSINGAFVALSLTVTKMMQRGLIHTNPIIHNICAIACAVQGSELHFDPTYTEDSSADADCNFVFTHKGALVEIQGTGERGPIDVPSFDNLLRTAFEHTHTARTEQLRALA